MIAPILTLLFTQSIETSKSPEDWLKAIVIPIFKNKGSRLDPFNYRPISLTCTICKVLEHIVGSKIMDHYERYEILDKNQHGFQKQRSCETQLINTLDELKKELDKRQDIHCFIRLR